MARVLKYPADCFRCGRRCDPAVEKALVHKSFLHLDHVSKKWMAHCYPCYDKSRRENRLHKSMQMTGNP